MTCWGTRLVPSGRRRGAWGGRGGAVGGPWGACTGVLPLPFKRDSVRMARLRCVRWSFEGAHLW